MKHKWSCEVYATLFKEDFWIWEIFNGNARIKPIRAYHTKQTAVAGARYYAKKFNIPIDIVIL